MLKATHIYHGGSIITMDSRCSIVDCLAVANGTILAAGTAEDVASCRCSETQLVDLKGKTMLPGFYDAHSHFMRAGMYDLFYLDLSAFPIGTARTLEDIASRIRERVRQTPPGEWILCATYDETALCESRHFTLAELDALAPDNPLFLRHISGHLGLFNSRAFATANITAETRPPAGGVFRTDGNGHLTGLVEEPPAMDKILEFAPRMSTEDWLASVRRATDSYTAKGVTTAHEGGTTTDMWKNYFTAHAQGLLKNRVQLLPRHGSIDLSQIPETVTGTPLTPDGMLTLGAVKLFQDGSIQGYTGYLSNPYHATAGTGHAEDWRGYPIRSRNALVDLVTFYHKQGRQVAIHGNGDDGIEDILVAFEEAQKALPRCDARHIIIHCQSVREDQLDRIARLQVVPSFFVVHTYYWGDRHRDIFLGPERAFRISPLRSALRRHIRFTNHNDTFVTPIDPLLSVWSAVNRMTSSGKILGDNQTISVIDALRSVTSWGAYQFNEEQLKGSLEPGKLADMVVLDENPLTVPSVRLRDIPIRATIVSNKIVFGDLD